MIEINGMQIEATGNEILNNLQISLHQNGINLLNVVKPEHNGNIQFSCPSHKGGQEKSPSCGMLTKTSYRNGREYDAGTVHCFTCGYTATLPEFISFCFGYNDGGIFGNNWLKANYSTAMVERDRHFNININRNKSTTNQLPNISDDILDSLAYTHPYMYKRGLTDEIIDKFDIGYDNVTDSITFPVSDIYGNIKWIQTRSVKGKFYKIPEGIVKTDYLYGVYQAIQSKSTSVVICESPLNALTLWKFNKPAIALFGTGGGNQYEMLKKLPFRHYLLALDPDEAGKNGTMKLINRLRRYKLLSRLEYPKNSYKDINDYGSDILKFKKIDINF